MAFSYSTGAQSQSKVAATTITVSVTLTAGQGVVVVVAKDNVQTTDGQTSEVTSVTDNLSNTYTKVAEFTNGQGGANSGATVAIYACKNVATGGSATITANLSSSITAKAITVAQFTKGASTRMEWDTGFQTLATDAADPANMTISGLVSKEYIFIRGIASEGTPVSGTATTSYTVFTGAVSSGTSGGGGASNMSVWAEFRILTGTGDSSNPTVAANDNASIYVAFYEQAVAAGPALRQPIAPFLHNLLR